MVWPITRPGGGRVRASGDSAMVSGVFGGADPTELAELVRNGFATWIDTDDNDETPIMAQGAALARAPIETVFATATDFERVHEFVRASLKNEILSRSSDELVVKLRQGVGLGFVSVGIEEVFRLRLHPPTAVTCEAYVRGTFSRATFEVHLHPITDDETLVVISFIANLRDLGRMATLFFKHQPEVEFAASGNILLVPALAIAQEAEARSGRRPGPDRGVSVPLWEALARGELAAPLGHGYLTAGRFDRAGQILDIASATRLGAPREKVWKVAEDPASLRDVLPVLKEGGLRKKKGDRLDSDLTYRVRIGKVSRRYEFRRHARFVEPEHIESIEATMTGHPAKQADFLFEDGPNTVLCHMYYTDIKRDWLSRIFLKAHPEFECVISMYAPVIVARGMRLRFGAPVR